MYNISKMLIPNRNTFALIQNITQLAADSKFKISNYNEHVLNLNEAS